MDSDPGIYFMSKAEKFITLLSSIYSLWLMSGFLKMLDDEELTNITTDIHSIKASKTLKI